MGRENKSMLINADHRLIIRPEGPDDIRYQTVRRFILNQTKAPSQVSVKSPLRLQTRTSSTAVIATPAQYRAPDPLFDAYTRNDEPFYIARSFDNVLLQSLGAGHVWLVGDSGVGKSAALRRAVYQNGWHLNHISLAGYEVDSAAQLFRALCVELGSMASISNVPPDNSAPSDLFHFLKSALRAFPTDLVIANVVEEMPLDAHNLTEFANLLAKFLDLLVGEPDLYGRIQFALSSLVDISTSSALISMKTREQIHLIPMDGWPIQDISRLIALLTSILKPDLSLNDQDKIANAALRSPRFVKQLFRHWRNGTCGTESVDKLISRVESEQV